MNKLFGALIAFLSVEALPAPVFAAQSSRSGSALLIQKSQTNLPQLQTAPEAKRNHSLEVVKPPNSGSFYEGSSKEAEYERLLDEEIKALYKLSKQNQKSQNRGEIWLRLGERYVEKARLVSLRAANEHEKKQKDYADGRTRIKPQLDASAEREYNEKAVHLYEWFVKDFPRDPKVDQALFFLGYNHFELGHAQIGERYYLELVKLYPDSAFITESHFALGEYYFENESWKKALDNYAKVVKVKRARLNTFASYKSAWCLYRLRRTGVALQALEKVIRQSRAGEARESSPDGARAVNKLRLAEEALKDYVPFFAEAGDPNRAEEEFARLSGNPKQALQMLERLAYIYADNGNRQAANATFRHLIAKSPSADKAAEYQYQIVISYATSDPKEFRRQLDIWLEEFGPTSQWAKENGRNEKLVSDIARLQETTLRNYILQHHQSAQASHAIYSQQVAESGYVEYARYFPNSPKLIEMQFFHAELLFDMGKYEEASRLYVFVAEKDTQGVYREKAIVNNLLALEKDLPSAKEIDQKRGKSLERLALDPSVERFEKAAIRYIKAFPKSEKTNDIKRRLGVIYYSYNHFDEALDLFEQVVRDSPSSENGEIAGNLILDIYKLRGDMSGFTAKGGEFLSNAAIARSKFGSQVRSMMERAGYLNAEKTSERGDSIKAAKEFEAFANANRNSELAVAATYKAAINYEKGADTASAVRMHKMVLAARSSDAKIKSAQNDSRNALARIYQQTGQLEAAAHEYDAYARANPQDPKSINATYNAAVIYDSLGDIDNAMKAYNTYYGDSNRADRSEILFAQAELLRRKGRSKKAAEYYETYVNLGGKTRVHIIQALYLLGDLAEQRGEQRKSSLWYSRGLAAYKASPKQARDETAHYPAEIAFKNAQPILKELAAVKFGATDKQQAKTAGQIKTLRETYITAMKDVIRFDNGAMIVAALASSGKMFEQIAGLFERIPVPTGFKPDEAAKYKELVQAQVQGFRNEAKNSYKAAIEKASELDVYSTWTRVARIGLNDGVDPGQFASEAHLTDWMGL